MELTIEVYNEATNTWKPMPRATKVVGNLAQSKDVALRNTWVFDTVAGANRHLGKIMYRVVDENGTVY